MRTPVLSALQQEGVRVVPRAKVRGTTSKAGEHSEIRLSTGDRLPACRIVVMAAAVPNTDLARRSGLNVDCKCKTDEAGRHQKRNFVSTLPPPSALLLENHVCDCLTQTVLAQRLGFKANSQLYVKDDIWAAGDCVSFCNPDCGRMRLDGLDHALASGRLAGQNMVAANKGKGEEAQNYNYVPVRWASLAPGATYEAVGEVDTRLATVGVFAPISENSRRLLPPRAHSCDPSGYDDVDYSHGVVFYLRDNVVVGVLLWNLSRRVATARKIIDNMIPYDELDDARYTGHFTITVSAIVPQNADRRPQVHGLRPSFRHACYQLPANMALLPAFLLLCILPASSVALNK
ncbi:Putative apoptosis-inducing factor 1, mitochondrial, partial [Gryllus bimaculatus]